MTCGSDCDKSHQQLCILLAVLDCITVTLPWYPLFCHGILCFAMVSFISKGIANQQ